MSVTLDSVIRQNEESLATEVDGEVLMMSVLTGKYYGLDKVGSFIWRRLAQPIRVAALCDAAEAVFDVDRERCERDTLTFLRGMVANGLVRRVE